MFWSWVSLFLVLLVVFAAWKMVAYFWAWLARGKRLRGVVERERVDESVRVAVEQVDRYRAERKLKGRKGVQGARPHLSREQREAVMQARAIERREFLESLHIGWYQVVMLFFIGSVLGLVLEEVWMFITAGLTQSRVGLVWGPFSPIYGVGAVLLTLITFALRRKGVPLWAVFLISVAVGGGLEQFAGWAMETFFGLYSWDYSNVPGALSKWVAVPFLVFWGVLGLAWHQWIMPNLLVAISVPTTFRQVLFVSFLALYLGLDIFMTFACFNRQAARDAGVPPANAFQEWIDENYTDQWIAGRFENLQHG